MISVITPLELQGEWVHGLPGAQQHLDKCRENSNRIDISFRKNGNLQHIFPMFFIFFRMRSEGFSLNSGSLEVEILFSQHFVCLWFVEILCHNCSTSLRLASCGIFVILTWQSKDDWLFTEFFEFEFLACLQHVLCWKPRCISRM